MKNKLLTAVWGVYMCFGFMLLFGVNANAYIDPSAMTYMIQAVAAVVIAVGAAITVYFRKAKKKVNDALGIDENRNKEVESDDISFTTASDEKKDDAKATD